MKQICLVILGALALAGSAKAGDLVPDRYGDIYHEGKLRQNSQGGFYRSQQEDLEEARRDARDQAYLNTEAALQRQIDVNTQIAIQENAKLQTIAKAKGQAAFIAGQESIAQRHGVAAQNRRHDEENARLPRDNDQRRPVMDDDQTIKGFC